MYLGTQEPRPVFSTAPPPEEFPLERQNTHRGPSFLSHPRVYLLILRRDSDTPLADTRPLSCVHISQRTRLTASAAARYPFCTQPCRLADSIGEYALSVEHWILFRLGHIVCTGTHRRDPGEGEGEAEGQGSEAYQGASTQLSELVCVSAVGWSSVTSQKTTPF